MIIEKIPTGHLQIRTSDGHRYVLAPGDDVSGQPAEVRLAAREAWTDQVRADHRAMIDAQAARDAAATSSPEAKAAAINAERQRRIEAGTVIDGVYVTGRDEDARNLTNLALAAQMRIAGGDTSTTTIYRDGNNVDHELTPPQVLTLWQQSANYVSALHAASWAIKAMEPLPADVTADGFWPSYVTTPN